MTLQPQQKIFQPAEIEIAERERGAGEQQHAENRRPFPAMNPFPAALEQKRRGENVSGQRERQAPEQKHLQRRRETDLQFPKPRGRRRRNADDDDNQQRAIAAFDEKPLHDGCSGGL